LNGDILYYWFNYKKDQLQMCVYKKWAEGASGEGEKSHGGPKGGG